MCDTWSTPWEIPPAIYEEVRALLPYLEHVIWLGGEVFLFEHFAELLEQSKDYPYLKQRINTNGLIMTEAIAENLLKNNVELIYSIDAVTRDTYEYIRKGARFPQLLDSLDLINEAKKKHPDKQFSLRMNAVIMKSNYRQVTQILDFAKEYGFDLVQLMPIVGEDSAEHIFSQKNRDAQALQFLDAQAAPLQEKAQAYHIELLNSLPTLHAAEENNNEAAEIRKEGATFCYLPWQQILIYPDGNVRFGCFCDDPIGNVRENSISTVWNSPKAVEYRQRVAGNTYQTLCGKRCVDNQISIKLRQVGEVKDE